jgi:hypothetical protein
VVHEQILVRGETSFSTRGSVLCHNLPSLSVARTYLLTYLPTYIHTYIHMFLLNLYTYCQNLKYCHSPTCAAGLEREVGIQTVGILYEIPDFRRGLVEAFSC